MRLQLGKTVRCSDGVFGELADVVVDPVTDRVTHLVVKPHKLDGVSRLVPIELAETLDEGQKEITLRCPIAEVQGLDYVQEYAYLPFGELPKSDGEWDVGVESVLSMTHDDFGLLGDDAGAYEASAGILYDRVPKGEAEIRHASTVRTADGHYVGDVNGMLIGSDGGITEVVVERGHLWRRRSVTIPIDVVASVETDTVTIALSRAEVDALPASRIHRWF